MPSKPARVSPNPLAPALAASNDASRVWLAVRLALSDAAETLRRAGRGVDATAAAELEARAADLVRQWDALVHVPLVALAFPQGPPRKRKTGPPKGAYQPLRPRRAKGTTRKVID